MHPNNKHKNSYNFKALIEANTELSLFVFTNDYNTQTIDFSNSQAVFELNKAILLSEYKLTDYKLPEGYLCPPIPGRADYIHYISDVITSDKPQINGLDIGAGANCIYPILGSQIYGWNMVGCDINLDAVKLAQENIRFSKSLSNNIEIRHQENPAFIFKDIIKPNEYYDFTMCNPPFHSSEAEALKGTKRKWKELKGQTESHLNFGGLSHELWCNGGEALFIKRMIKESVLFKSQVGWFTSLVAKGSHLTKLCKQLDKLEATYKIIDMTQGQKISRLLAWQFNV